MIIIQKILLYYIHLDNLHQEHLIIKILLRKILYYFHFSYLRKGNLMV